MTEIQKVLKRLKIEECDTITVFTDLQPVSRIANPRERIYNLVSTPQLSAKTHRKPSRHPAFPQKSIADSGRQSIFPEKSTKNPVGSVLLQKVALPTQNNKK
jgi:hypothetical protein